MVYKVPKCECAKNLILSITETTTKDYEITENIDFTSPMCEVLEDRMTILFCQTCGNMYEHGLTNEGDIVKGKFIKVIPQYLKRSDDK